MLNVTIGEERFSIKNEFNEITIGEFETITELLNDKNKDNFEKFYSVFILLGIDVDMLDQIDLNGFSTLINEWKDFGDLDIDSFVRTVEFDGVTYSAYEEGKEFKFTVKMMRQINAINKTDIKYSDVLSVIFKNDETDDKEVKSELFNNITCDIALPYIIKYNSEIMNSIDNIMKNA